MLKAQERLDAEIVRTMAQWRRMRAWEADGSLSAVAWLTHRAPVGASEARRLVKTARIVDDAPLLGDALADGETTTAHVRALAGVMSDRRRTVLPDHEQVLAEQAESLSVRSSRCWRGGGRRSPMTTSPVTPTTSTNPATGCMRR